MNIRACVSERMPKSLMAAKEQEVILSLQTPLYNMNFVPYEYHQIQSYLELYNLLIEE